MLSLSSHQSLQVTVLQLYRHPVHMLHVLYMHYAAVVRQTVFSMGSFANLQAYFLH